MILADPHLLGSRDGHWLDRWRREWQMHRAFQTAMTLHRPEVVFVLGTFTFFLSLSSTNVIFVLFVICYTRYYHCLVNFHYHWWIIARYFLANTIMLFISGDLFDEGDKSSEKEFNEVVQRFHQLFTVPEGTTLYAVAGNHDIGFHYRFSLHFFGEQYDKYPRITFFFIW